MFRSFTSNQSIAFAPNLSVQEFDRLIIKAIKKLNSWPKSDVFRLIANSDLETICQLLAAWRLSLTVLLLSPHLPPREWIFPKRALGPGLILLTSGSSATPKPAFFQLKTLLESARTVSQKLKAKPHDLWSLSLPLSHVGGLGVLLRALISGGTLLLEKTPSPQATFASLVPTQLYRLLSDENFRSSTHFLLGGAPLSKNLYERAIKRDLHISLTYGLTEMSSTILLTDRPVWQGEIPFLGLPLPGREIKLEGAEIFVRGNSLFEGYGFPPIPPGEWFATRDIGTFVPEHGFAILGRKDFQFISGGENIQPEEIETALLSHPLVEQALVVPHKDLEFGQRPVAFIKSSLCLKTLSEHLLSLLPKYKIPVKYLPFPEGQTSLKPSRKALIDYVSKNLA